MRKIIYILMVIGFLMSISPAYALLNGKALLSYYPSLMAIGDYKNDGKNELVISFPASTGGGVYALNNPCAGLNLGWSPLALGAPNNMLIGDYNNDGKNKIVISYPPSAGGGIYALQNPSATLGGWTEIIPSSPSMPGMMVIGDYNGDGENELIISFSPIGGLYALSSTGATELLNVAFPDKMIIGDYNNDGEKELIIAIPGGGIYALDNPAAGVNAGFRQLAVGPSPSAMVVGDYNDDGKNELVISYPASSGGGIYALTNPSAGPGGWTAIAQGAPDIMLIADYDNDGKKELIVSTQAFGVFGTGLYALKDTTAGFNIGWEQLLSSAPSIMVFGDYDNDGANKLIVSFAPFGGVYSLEEDTGDNNLAIICPPDITVEAEPGCEAVVALGQPTVTSSCGVTSVTNNAPSVFPLGTTKVTWTATSVLGNSVTCEQDVTVEDTIPPVVTIGNNNQNIDLWPPDHRMVTIPISVTDNCPVTVSVDVTNSEAGITIGAGGPQHDPDVVIALDKSYVQVRAERSGTGVGRLYTITVTATDKSGNATTKSINATVGHDRRK